MSHECVIGELLAHNVDVFTYTMWCVFDRYSTWEPEDNILDPRLVLAYEEK